MRTVQLSARTHKRLSAYAKVANISVQQAINDACKEWMDSDGDMLTAFIQRKYKAAQTTGVSCTYWFVSRWAGLLRLRPLFIGRCVCPPFSTLSTEQRT
jgi:hypothetical protein